MYTGHIPIRRRHRQTGRDLDTAAGSKPGRTRIRSAKPVCSCQGVYTERARDQPQYAVEVCILAGEASSAPAGASSRQSAHARQKLELLTDVRRVQHEGPTERKYVDAELSVTLCGRLLIKVELRNLPVVFLESRCQPGKSGQRPAVSRDGFAVNVIGRTPRTMAQLMTPFYQTDSSERFRDNQEIGVSCVLGNHVPRQIHELSARVVLRRLCPRRAGRTSSCRRRPCHEGPYLVIPGTRSKSESTLARLASPWIASRQ